MNEGWNPAWGGALELWDSRMKHRVKTVDCLINRAVICSTPRALQGFPEPIKCPPGQSRKSQRWYYCPVDKADDVMPESIATVYFARPEESPLK
jgi:hypothetical protein